MQTVKLMKHGLIEKVAFIYHYRVTRYLVANGSKCILTFLHGDLEVFKPYRLAIIYQVRHFFGKFVSLYRSLLKKKTCVNTKESRQNNNKNGCSMIDLALILGRSPNASHPSIVFPLFFRLSFVLLRDVALLTIIICRKFLVLKDPGEHCDTKETIETFGYTWLYLTGRALAERRVARTTAPIFIRLPNKFLDVNYGSLPEV